jgi:hypothetical protein
VPQLLLLLSSCPAHRACNCRGAVPQNTGFWTIQLCDDTAVQLHSEAVAPSLLRRSVDSTSRGTLWGHALEPHARAAHTDTAPPTQGAREAEVTVLLGTYAGEASDRIALLPDGGVGLIRSYTRGQDGREARVLFVADEDEDAAVQATGGDGAARPTASLAAAEEAESLRYRLRVRVSLPAVLARLRERVKAGSSAAAAAAGGGAAAPAAAPPATADRALEGLYVMRSALSVLRRLRGLCAVVKDSWWTTEACVGLAARQYHQNELGQKEQQVSLGAFDAEAVAEQERGRPEASSTGKDATRGAELGPDGAELGPPTGSAHGPTGVSGPPGEPRGRDGSPLPDPSQLVRIGGLGALVQTLERGQPPHESSPQPFLAQRFAHGDDCGEARPGRKRELELRLACKPGVRLEVTSLTEPETCRYVLSGFSAAVCSHPLLRLHTAMLPAASGALPGGGVTCHRV